MSNLFFAIEWYGWTRFDVSILKIFLMGCPGYFENLLPKSYWEGIDFFAARIIGAKLRKRTGGLNIWDINFCLFSPFLVLSDFLQSRDSILPSQKNRPQLFCKKKKMMYWIVCSPPVSTLKIKGLFPQLLGVPLVEEDHLAHDHAPFVRSACLQWLFSVTVYKFPGPSLISRVFWKVILAGRLFLWLYQNPMTSA